jgi:endonuclease/exonuclease/phosphatase family metal-dependent hydrolase
MKFSVLTYNLFHNKSLKNLDKVINTYRADILCLQELHTEEEHLLTTEKLGYKMADFSNSFIWFGKVYGIATYYNPATIQLKSSKTLTLPRSFYDVLVFFLRGNHNPRTVLKTDFVFMKSKKKLTVYNVHLTAWATNRVRVKQIKETLNDLKIFNQHNVVITGDFNYSYKRKQLESLIHEYGLKEATSNLLYTLELQFLRFLFVRLKSDYILYKDISVIKTEKIPVFYSDHFPVYAEFEF